VLREKVDVTIYGIIITAVMIAVDLVLFFYLGSDRAQKRWNELG